jgi:hypothetical protein
MRRRILAGQSAEAVADWLIAEGVPPPPDAKSWSGRLVIDLLTDPILSGCRQLRKEISKLIYKTGKHRAEPNPGMPEIKDCPSLVHMTVEEQTEMIECLAARNPGGQKSSAESPLWNVPRSRSRWPGQAVRCSACNGPMYRYGKLLKSPEMPGGKAAGS